MSFIACWAFCKLITSFVLYFIDSQLCMQVCSFCHKIFLFCQGKNFSCCSRHFRDT